MKYPHTQPEGVTAGSAVSEARTYVIPISNGILERRHRETIGAAIWLFMWLVDKCTKEQDDHKGNWLGLVLGGTPITARYVAKQLGESERSVRRHLKQLEEGGYIVVLSRNGEASGYAIGKSKKFHRAQPFIVESEQPQDDAEPRPKMATVGEEPRPKVATPPTKNGRSPGQICPRNKEEITGHIQGEDSKPVRAKKQRAGVDPRREPFIDALKGAWDYYNPGIKFEPSPAAFRNVDLFLKVKRSLDLETFKRLLFNRFRSEGIVPSDPIEGYVCSLERYAHGPIDRFGKLMNGDKKHATNGKTETITANLSAALEQRRARRMASATAGDLAERVSGPTADEGGQRDIPSRVGELIQAGRG